MFNPKVFGADKTQSTAALGRNLQATTTGARFYKASIYNTDVAAQYVQFHDSAGIPANGAIPFAQIKLAADSGGSLDYPDGRACKNGIFVGISTVSGSFAAGVANVLNIDVAYRNV
jgi:hypothetical protein